MATKKTPEADVKTKASPSNPLPQVSRRPFVVRASANRAAEEGDTQETAGKDPVATSSQGAPRTGTDVGRLIVGRDIALAGDIIACDHLIVQGHIEATMGDGETLEITPTGLYKGQVTVTTAEIAGRFEGSLTVRSRLTVRRTAVINGVIRYGELSVEAGGKLLGDIDSNDNPAREQDDDDSPLPMIEPLRARPETPTPSTNAPATASTI